VDSISEPAFGPLRRAAGPAGGGAQLDSRLQAARVTEGPGAPFAAAPHSRRQRRARPAFGHVARAALAALIVGAATAGPVPAQASVTVADDAPDFTLRTMDGPNLRLQEQRGRVVMVNFWATWCGPCRQEMPHLNRLYGKYRAAGFTLLGVNIDEDRDKAIALASRLGLQFPVLLDTDKTVSRRYDLSTMPSTLLIDRDGRVRYVHLGYRDGDEHSYERRIRELLKE
jgi:peroxiredoxin